ncbi:unnamed protein product [Ectocarpus sp. CCAP 1310/34]|nr:unnamed protein product [Ectocarpus sp. CCAP 1310/34]
MRPYPVAGNDTSAGDPVTPESDDSGKDERNDHQPAIASAPSPQVTDDSVGTSVGGSGGDHSPKLPLEPSQSGVELLGNEVRTELDGGSTSHGSSTGDVPVASPALLSTSPPLGHGAGIAAASPPQATDDSVGISVGGSGRVPTPKLPLQGGIKLLRNEVSTEIGGDSTSRDSSAGGFPTTSPAPLSTSPAPLGDRAAIASASFPQATPVGTSVRGRSSERGGKELLPTEVSTELDGDSTSRDPSTRGGPAASPAPFGDRAAIVSASSPQAIDDSVGTSVGGSGGDHSPYIPLESPRSGMELLRNKFPTELDGDSTSRDPSTGGVQRVSFGDGSGGAGDDTSGPFEQEHARKEVDEQTSEGALTIEKIDATQEQKVEGALTGGVQATSPALLSTSPAPLCTKHGTSASSNGRRTGAGGGFGGGGDRAKDGPSRPFEQEHGRKEVHDQTSQGAPTIKEIDATQVQEEEEALTRGVPATSPALLSTPHFPLFTEHGTKASSNGRRTGAGGGLGGDGAGGSDCDRGDRANDPSRPLEQERARDEQTTPFTKEINETHKREEDEQALRGLLRPFGQERARKEADEQPGQGTPVTKETNDTQEQEETLLLRARIEQLEVSAQTQASKHGEAERRAESLEGELRGLADRCRLETAAREAAERDAQRCMGMFAEARVARKDARVVAEGKDRELASEIAAREAAERNARQYTDLFAEARAAWSNTQEIVEDKERKLAAAEARMMKTEAGGGFCSLQRRLGDARRGRELNRQQSLEFKLALEEQLAAGGGTSEGGGRGSSVDDGGGRAAAGEVSREGRVGKVEVRLETAVDAEAALAVEAVLALVASVEAKAATGQAVGGGGNSGVVALAISSPPSPEESMLALDLASLVLILARSQRQQSACPYLRWSLLAGPGREKMQEWVSQPHEQHALTLLHAPEEIDVSDAGSGSFEAPHPSPSTPNKYSGSERVAGSGIDGRFSEGTQYDHDGHVAATATDSGLRSPLASAETARNLTAASGAATETPGGAEKLFRDYSNTYGSSACGNARRGAKEVILRAGTFLERLAKNTNVEEGLMMLEVDGGSIVKVVMEVKKFLELHETKDNYEEHVGHL